jgi:O-antigen ligase
MSATAAGPRPRGAAPDRALRHAEDLLLLALAMAISLSIAATEIAFFLTAALRLRRAALGEPLRLRPRGVALAWAGLAAAWILSGCCSPEPWESLLRVHRLYVVLTVFLVAERAADGGFARRLAAAYLIGAATGSAFGLLSWVQALRGHPGWRLAGSFSTAMTAGNVLATAFIAAFAVCLGESGRLRWLAGGGGAVVAAALAATRTRSSWLGAIAGAMLVGVAGRWRRWAVPALAILVLAAAAVPAVRERAATVLDAQDFTARGRVSLWMTGWDLFRERPLVGWGLADHKQRISEHRRPDATFIAGHFHNNLVQVAVSGGAVGLAAFAALHAGLAWALWRRRRSTWSVAALGVWASFQIAGLFDWSFGDAEVAYQFFFWMGLGLADNDEDGAPPS